jgi:hypothetical protein
MIGTKTNSKLDEWLELMFRLLLVQVDEFVFSAAVFSKLNKLACRLVVCSEGHSWKRWRMGSNGVSNRFGIQSTFSFSFVISKLSCVPLIFMKQEFVGPSTHQSEEINSVIAAIR